MAADPIFEIAGIAFSARSSSPLVRSAGRSFIFLFGRRGNGKRILRGVDPLIAFVDEHDGDVIHDWVFAPAILADEPGILVEGKQSLFFTNAIGAA
jgi:hypothetical protein